MQLDWEPDPQQGPGAVYAVASREVRVEENGPQDMGSIEVLSPGFTIFFVVSHVYMLIFMLSPGHSYCFFFSFGGQFLEAKWCLSIALI